MSAPKSDRAGVRQAIRALRAAGYGLSYVYDGEDRIPVSTEAAAIGAVMAVDDAILGVVRKTATQYDDWGRVWFVLGNDPDEVISDHTVNLEPVLGPLMEGWWDR